MLNRSRFSVDVYVVSVFSSSSFFGDVMIFVCVCCVHVPIYVLVRMSLCRTIAYVQCALRHHKWLWIFFSSSPSSCIISICIQCHVSLLGYYELPNSLFSKERERDNNTTTTKISSNRERTSCVCVYGLESCANLHNIFQTILESNEENEEWRKIKINKC